MTFIDNLRAAFLPRFPFVGPGYDWDDILGAEELARAEEQIEVHEPPIDQTIAEWEYQAWQRGATNVAAEERLQRNPHTIAQLQEAEANISNAVEMTLDRLGINSSPRPHAAGGEQPGAGAAPAPQAAPGAGHLSHDLQPQVLLKRIADLEARVNALSRRPYYTK